MSGRDQKQLVSVRLIAAWKEALNRGMADRMCDRITIERDPPQKLLGAVYGRVVWEENKKRLSRRERQCLSLVSFGFKTKEIAKFLKISHYTVLTHLRKAKIKLGTNNQTEAVVIAFRLNEII